MIENIMRQRFERLIVKQVITDLLAAGCELFIDHDGDSERIDIKDTSDVTMEEMFACDEESLYVKQPGQSLYGFVQFIYGNSGYDVISDYTISLEKLLEPTQRLADKLENGEFEIILNEDSKP